MTAAEPLVSIALCTYNGERHLREQLDSILAQEGVRIEVVALDDGSSDGTVALLRDYAARDPRIAVHVNEKNLGHLRSFEKAMGLCTGAFIAPSDQDDVWEPRKLRVLLDAIGDADLAYCDSAYMDEGGLSMRRRISDDLVMHAGRDPQQFLFQNTVSGHAMLLRAALLQKAGPAPGLLYHDWWLGMCAASHAGLVYVDAPLVRFRRHGSAASPLGRLDGKRMSQRKWRRQGYLGTGPRKWVAERIYLADAFAATGWPGSDAGPVWKAAWQDALERRRGPLVRAMWRYRRSLPPWTYWTWFNAYQFYKRSLRKIERMPQDDEPTTPLFRM